MLTSSINFHIEPGDTAEIGAGKNHKWLNFGPPLPGYIGRPGKGDPNPPINTALTLHGTLDNIELLLQAGLTAIQTHRLEVEQAST